MRGFKTAIGALRKATGGDAAKRKGTLRDGDNGRRRPNRDDDGDGDDESYGDLDGDQIIDSV